MPESASSAVPAAAVTACTAPATLTGPFAANAANWQTRGPGPASAGEPLQHRIGAGQHRAHGQRQLLPGHGLALAHLERPCPGQHLAPVQAHQRVRVVVLGDLADADRAYGHAELFDQFTAQRLRYRLARLQLAAGKLPI